MTYWQEIKTRPSNLIAVFVPVNTKEANQFIEQRRSNTAMIADATPFSLIVIDLCVADLLSQTKQLSKQTLVSTLRGCYEIATGLFFW